MLIIRAKGFKEAARSIQRINKSQIKHVNKAILKSLIQVQREVRIKSPVVTGFLRNNILFDQPRKMRGDWKPGLSTLSRSTRKAD